MRKCIRVPPLRMLVTFLVSLAKIESESARGHRSVLGKLLETHVLGVAIAVDAEHEPVAYVHLPGRRNDRVAAGAQRSLNDHLPVPPDQRDAAVSNDAFLVEAREARALRSIKLHDAEEDLLEVRGEGELLPGAPRILLRQLYVHRHLDRATSVVAIGRRRVDLNAL